MLWLLLACGTPSPPMPPGILLVTIDTWRADHLNEGVSPEAYALAQRGMSFDQAYTTIGLTTPAHASLFTGLTPPKHGLRANNHHGYNLAAEHVTLAEHFQANGWATAAFVSAYPAGPDGGLDQGFGQFEGPASGERPTSETLESARHWLVEQNTPWFLWVHAYDPHGPYEAPPSMRRAEDPPKERGDYAAEVRYADRLLGPLYREVLAAGGSVVLTSDHGEVLDEEICHWQHARSSSDAVLKIPLVVAGPHIKPGVSSSPVSILDLFPTLLKMAKISDPGGHEGQDLFGPTQPRALFAESGLCETTCSPGCSPEGVAGKDLVRIDSNGRHRLRLGSSDESNSALTDLFSDYAAPGSTPPTDSIEIEQGKLLGYLDAP